VNFSFGLDWMNVDRLTSNEKLAVKTTVVIFSSIFFILFALYQIGFFVKRLYDGYKSLLFGK
jgi:hypothetical protein